MPRQPSPPPTLKIEEWPIERFQPYKRNPRVLTDANIGLMVKNITEFGFKVPLVAKSDGTLVDGHMRLAAARKLGMATVPVALADDLTDAQIRAFRIAINQSATWAEWDFSALAEELAALKAEDFNLELLGFDEDGLARSLAGFGPLPDGSTQPTKATGSLTDRFMVAPFSVLNAREGWWQNRKRLWIELGIQSELGRGDASPGGSDRPSADYSNSERGDGTGRSMGRRANAIPGGLAFPTIDKATGKIYRSDSRSRPIPGTIAGTDGARES